MTILKAKINHELSPHHSTERLTVSVYVGSDAEHLSFAGHIIVTAEEAQDIVQILDGQDKHLIRLDPDGWTIRHPLSCRPGLFSCTANGWDCDSDNETGVFTLEQHSDGWFPGKTVS